MNGNWLQDLLNWYWITPWQLALLMALECVAAFIAGTRVTRRISASVSHPKEQPRRELGGPTIC